MSVQLTNLGLGNQLANLLDGYPPWPPQSSQTGTLTCGACVMILPIKKRLKWLHPFERDTPMHGRPPQRLGPHLELVTEANQFALLSLDGGLPSLVS